MSTADDIRAAKALIDTPEKWTSSPKSEEGRHLNANGALFVATRGPNVRGAHGGERFHKALAAVERLIPSSHRGKRLYIYNQRVTHPEIIDLFDQAIQDVEWRDARKE